ncbi:MAG: 30S ribosomal protein S17 [Candidatus Terrybacteria bacterium RIFCSPHIGHO2_01_FULL_58_15]|uniref:Small ribosomal subunit protein uS17 n=1 Tax=Terrybacteria sp. (strain RIFCSPHIGHO2_01_FULL_58_15) TaxID=1802363 RepID=A0A1G2PMH3_TERXR|nr:MAG: 30S ribosomal protein S17 [Candidatus Terrybacteria bacterium RIFCSPHIGHO2_01_FULL_58_15]
MSTLVIHNDALRTVHRRRFRGVVVRAVLPKTVTVRVERRFRHPRVGRVVRVMRKFLAHDERGLAQEGDTVVIEETRPLSRRKRFRIAQVIQRAAREEGVTEEEEA